MLRWGGCGLSPRAVGYDILNLIYTSKSTWISYVETDFIACWTNLVRISIADHISSQTLLPWFDAFVVPCMCPARCKKGKLKRPAARRDLHGDRAAKTYGYNKEINSKFRDKLKLQYSAERPQTSMWLTSLQSSSKFMVASFALWISHGMCRWCSICPMHLRLVTFAPTANAPSCAYIYIYTYTVYIHIYIEREREPLFTSMISMFRPVISHYTTKLLLVNFTSIILPYDLYHIISHDIHFLFFFYIFED